MNCCDVEANYKGKYVACVKQYVPPDRREERCRHCKRMLEQFDQQDFLKFWYSDEAHFGWKQRSMGRQYISRQPGERYEPWNIREAPAPEEVDDEKVHIWGCIGLGFQSQLVRYRPNNKNGKMSQRVYLEQILEPHVGRWLEEGRDFWLEEDNDSGHGGGSSSNIVRKN